MSIQECFNGKNIFVTGFTGIIGKALVEKLLRSCPDVGNIYVLLRTKKGKSIHERIQKVVGVPLFDSLRKANPDAFRKIKPIAGDITELDLGISEADKKTLVENVNIIFHGAASIRFDDHLKDAIITNVRGTREAIKLALHVKNIIAFVHMSTAYSNLEDKIIEEKLYPAPMDWRDAIVIAEDCLNLQVRENLTEKLICPFPNTYTFTKALGEHVVNDLCRGRIPAAVVRPSIVSPAWNDPLEGWYDSITGIVGLGTGISSGLIREIHATPETCLNSVPLDFVNRVLILTVLKINLMKNWNKVPVYNCCIDSMGISIRDLNLAGDIVTWTQPATTLLWYPQFNFNPYFSLYQYTFIISHIIPAIIFDTLLWITGNKTRVLSLSRKGYIGNIHLATFTNNSWFIKNDEVVKLKELVEDSERKSFSFEEFFDWKFREHLEWTEKSKILIFNYILRVKTDPVRGLRLTRIFWALDRILKSLFSGCIFYLFYCLICKYLNYVKQL